MSLAKKSIVTIGSAELIDFPDFQLEKIPAKIDTGADSSAVWASNIVIDGHILSYCLFGPGSVFFSSEVISTEVYKVTKVRNSFGYQEFRYKVKLRIKIGDRKLLSWFTLADRSQNTFPVLLGKNFLRTRFVVDVSSRHILEPGLVDRQLIVLSSQPELNKAYFAKVASNQTVKTLYTSIGYDCLMFNIKPRNISVTIAASAQDIADCQLVYIKNHQADADEAQAVARYLEFKAVNFIGREIRNDSSVGKLSEYMRLATNDLPIPDSISALPALLKDQYGQLKTMLGEPFVLKESLSNRGKNNFLIRSKEAFDKILAKANERDIYIAQRYITNDGYYRLLVTGREVALIIKRTTIEHQDPLKAHLNQPAGGVNASLISQDAMPTEAKELAVRAAAVMEREIAGVDLIQDQKTKQWYILEVNNAPQMRTGAFLEDKLKAVAQYFDYELSR